MDLARLFGFFMSAIIPRKAKEPEYDMTELRTVAIEFDEEQYRIGEAKVNRNLSRGLAIQKWFQTDSGVVIFMAKWREK